MKPPRVSSVENPVPSFLDAEYAASFLGLNEIGTLQNIRPYMSYLELPHDEGWTGHLLYPVSYLLPLRTVFRMNDRRGYIGPAEAFSETPAARTAILDAEINLDLDINEAATDGVLAPIDIVSLTGVERSTITRWHQSGYAEFTKTEAGRLQISIDGLKKALTWHRPAAYDPVIRPANRPLEPLEPVLRRPFIAPQQ
jgi:hypothetical protein